MTFKEQMRQQLLKASKILKNGDAKEGTGKQLNLSHYFVHFHYFITAKLPMTYTSVIVFNVVQMYVWISKFISI